MKNHKTLLILIIIMIISSIWLLSSGMPYGHDTVFHYDRIISLANTIKNGNFLALIHDYYYGYGYATGLFYSNFYFYIPAGLKLIGFNTMTSFKVFLFIINILTTISIYTCLKRIIKDNKISVIGTILYMFSNYRLVDIYARCALGEILAFMIIPIVILGIYEILYGNYKKWYIFSISFVLLVLSHIISSLLMAIFIFVFILINYKKLTDKNRFKYLTISSIIGILLGLFFVLPILEQKIAGNINIFEDPSIFVPTDNIVSIKDFLIPTGLFNKHLGFSLILLLPLRLFIKKKGVSSLELLKFADTIFILGIIAWILTLCPLFSILKFIQFTWRYLLISSLLLTISSCIYLKLLNKPNIKKIAIILIISISILELALYSFWYSFKVDNRNTFDNNNIGTGEYLIYKTNINDLDHYSTYTTNNPNILIKYNKKGTTINIKYSNNNSKNTYIELPLFNYLGYNSDSTKIINGNNNLIRLPIKDKSGNIKVSYKGTNIQKISYIVSSITLVGLIIYIIKEKRR